MAKKNGLRHLSTESLVQFYSQSPSACDPQDCWTALSEQQGHVLTRDMSCDVWLSSGGAAQTSNGCVEKALDISVVVQQTIWIALWLSHKINLQGWLWALGT